MPTPTLIRLTNNMLAAAARKGYPAIAIGRGISGTDVPERLIPAVICRLKIVGDLSIAKSKTTQWGSLPSIKVKGKEVKMTLITVPLHPDHETAIVLFNR